MTGFRVPDLDGMTAAEMIASVRVWYHTLELQGCTTSGVYNMAETVEHYHFPEDLSGCSVLDVGASNGFFSFLFESRGASVVATELEEYRQHDYPNWYRAQEMRGRSEDDIASINWHELHGGFTVAHKLLNSSVEKVRTTVYDIPRNCPGPFDLAFCSNVFVHLKNPVGAMEAIREVVRPGGRAIFATPVETSFADRSAATFVGNPAFCAWWVPTPAGLLKMCEVAGFVNARVVGTYVVSREHGTEIVDHIGVVHCERAE